MKPKLAIVLQVCPLDVWTGKRLVELICSIEPVKRSDIEFVLSVRRGTNPVATREIGALAREKFEKVIVLQNKRFGEGWPMGCNDLWQETMMRIGLLHDEGKLLSTGALTFESDCLPMLPSWLDLLAQAWSKAEGAGKECLGHAHGEPAPTHINGNAIFSCKITVRHPQLEGSSATAGWDVDHGPLLLGVGQDTDMIAQRYRIKSITREQVEAIRKNGAIPALFHGIKGTDGLEAIEAMVEDGSFFNREGMQPSIESKL